MRDRRRQGRLWPWAALTAAAVIALVIRITGTFPGDVWLLNHLRGLPDAPLHVISFIGGAAGIGVLSVLFAWQLRHGLRPMPFLVAMAVVALIERGLKMLVGRETPKYHELGFPSGHAMGSLTLVLLVCGTVWPALTRRQRVLVGLVSAVFVIAVGISRLGLRVHWPSDVVGGWLIAAAYAMWVLPVVRRS